jgi:hypothetical protein
MQLHLLPRVVILGVAILGVLAGVAQTRDFQPLLSYIER